MHSYRAVQLIVEPDLFIWRVVTTRQLDAVHAEVGSPYSRLVDVFGINLGKRDESASVLGPTYLVWQLLDEIFRNSSEQCLRIWDHNALRHVCAQAPHETQEESPNIKSLSVVIFESKPLPLIVKTKDP